MKMKLFSMHMLAVAGDTGTLENNLNDFGTRLNALVSVLYPWFLGLGSVLIGIWGLALGIQIIKANKAEDKQLAKTRVKQLIIGIAVIFIIMVGGPLMISGLAAWAGTSIAKFS